MPLASPSRFQEACLTSSNPRSIIQKELCLGAPMSMGPPATFRISLALPTATQVGTPHDLREVTPLPRCRGGGIFLCAPLAVRTPDIQTSLRWERGRKSFVKVPFSHCLWELCFLFPHDDDCQRLPPQTNVLFVSLPGGPPPSRLFRDFHCWGTAHTPCLVDSLKRSTPI